MKQTAPTSLQQDSDMVGNEPTYVEIGISSESNNQSAIGFIL